MRGVVRETMRPILSILVPSIPIRVEQMTRLVNEINAQKLLLQKNHSTLERIEVIFDDSKSFLDGGLSIGKKREKLVKEAKGKYLCFLDDDDLPAPNYLETLVRLCYHGKDVVTFRNFTTTDNYWTLIDMSLDNKEDEEATPDRIVKRRPWHVCPVLSRYAKEFEFPNTNYFEDSVWVDQVLKLCKNEVHTNMILSSYRHSSKTSEADKIMNHVQSIK